MLVNKYTHVQLCPIDFASTTHVSTSKLLNPHSSTQIKTMYTFSDLEEVSLDQLSPSFASPFSLPYRVYIRVHRHALLTSTNGQPDLLQLLPNTLAASYLSNKAPMVSIGPFPVLSVALFKFIPRRVAVTEIVISPLCSTSTVVGVGTTGDSTSATDVSVAPKDRNWYLDDYIPSRARRVGSGAKAASTASGVLGRKVGIA